MKFRDVVQHYLGCEVFGTYSDNSGSRGYLTGVTNGGADCEIQFILEDGINVEEEPYFNEISEVKPILRRLESMAAEERDEIFPSCHTEYWPEISDEEFTVTEVIEMLKKHFDLFGLLDNGEAIDADTLNKK